MANSSRAQIETIEKRLFPSSIKMTMAMIMNVVFTAIQIPIYGSSNIFYGGMIDVC